MVNETVLLRSNDHNIQRSECASLSDKKRALAVCIREETAKWGPPELSQSENVIISCASQISPNKIMCAVHHNGYWVGYIDLKNPTENQPRKDYSFASMFI